jgi:hypothetical protein
MIGLIADTTSIETIAKWTQSVPCKNRDGGRKGKDQKLRTCRILCFEAEVSEKCNRDRYCEHERCPFRPVHKLYMRRSTGATCKYMFLQAKSNSMGFLNRRRGQKALYGIGGKEGKFEQCGIKGITSHACKRRGMHKAINSGGCTALHWV